MLRRTVPRHTYNKIRKMNEKLKAIAWANAHPAELIRLALQPMTLVEFAAKYGWPKADVTLCIRGHRYAEKVRAALAEHLDVPRHEIDRLLDRMRIEEGKRAA